jgi:hypothetical protein
VAREQKSSRRSSVLMSRAAGIGRRFACDRSTRQIPKRFPLKYRKGRL